MIESERKILDLMKHHPDEEWTSKVLSIRTDQHISTTCHAMKRLAERGIIQKIPKTRPMEWKLIVSIEELEKFHVGRYF